MTTRELFERCEALVPVLAGEADRGEELRQVSPTAMAAVEAAGIRAAVTPTSLGGDGLGLDALCGVNRILARGCPASAWTISFLLLHSWFLAKLPPDGCAEVFADGPSPGAACPVAPTGMVEPVDGGFLVTGRWEYATAVRHSEWVMVHAIEDIATLTSRFCVLPVGEVVVEDVWFTTGMRATGSETIVLDRVFVPTRRTISSSSLLEGTAEVPGDGLAGIPLMSVLALTASTTALGAAEAALELYRDRLASRILAYTLGDRAAEQPAAQMRLAGAADAVQGALDHAERAVAAIVAASADGTPSDLDRVRARLAAASTVRASRAAISTICEGAGAAVYRDGHPLQRIQRDVETLKGHVVFDWDRTTELAGRVMLGGSLGPTDMA